MANIFLILGLAIIAATIIGYFAKMMKQPLVLAYIVTGFLLGPSAFKIFSDLGTVMVLSEMGITFLLFTVGLHLNLDNLKELGLVSFFTGLGQVIVMSLAGFLISSAFGFSTIASLYIGICIAFSSTIIIVKMLGEKNEINSLHGRISIGFLIVQDFIAIGALILVAGIGTGSSILSDIGSTLVKAALFIIGVVLLTKYIIPKIFDSVAKNQELLFLSSISYCFALGIISYVLNLSIEIGAFLAGVSLAILPYSNNIEVKISPLRDFFVTIFFITLGAEMSFSLSSQILYPLILLSVLVLIGTPVILMILMGAMGYRKRTSFLVGVTVAQISEFSLILIALGEKMGHINHEAVSLVTSVGVITITVSAYMIMYGHKIYYKVSHLLTFFERKNAIADVHHLPGEESEGSHIVVVGYHRAGYAIVHKLQEMEKSIIIVDFDPEVIKHLMKRKIPCIYGDIGDPDVLKKINLKEAEMVISTTADMDDNLKLMERAKELNPGVVVIMLAEHVDEALSLYDNGADYVILPHILSGQHASLMLEDISTNFETLLESRIQHIEELQNRTRIHSKRKRK